MALKQTPGSLSAPDGSHYVTLTDGAGNLINATGGSGGSTVSGDVASGDPDSGNPVKVGGVYNSTQPTFTTGDRGDLQLGSRGSLRVEIFSPSGANATAVLSAADALANSIGLTTTTQNELYNGTTWDRQRSLGSGASLQTSTTGVPVAVSVPNNATQCGIVSTATSAAASAIVLKASAGNLFSINVNATAAGFIMVFDATAAPADGAVTPVYTFPVAANGGYSTDFEYPIRCNTGITLVYSSTGPFTKTASATAFMSGQFL